MYCTYDVLYIRRTFTSYLKCHVKHAVYIGRFFAATNMPFVETKIAVICELSS